MARRRRRGGGVAAFLIFAAVATAGVIWGPELWERHGDRLSTQRCTVSFDGESDTLTAEQADNAALIAARSAARGLRARAATIGIATAIQESGLRNIDYGDRDSLGLFQQRPSQGWGTVEEVMDPWHAADAFYAGLVKVSGWEDAEITVAAQAVQRSGFPEAYADHEPEARLWATGLRGYGGPAAVTCDISTPDASTPAAYLARLTADFGEGMYQVAVTGIGDAQRIDVTALDGTEVTRDQFAAWAVATASSTGAIAVTTSESTWTVADGMVAEGVPELGAAVRIEIRAAEAPASPRE
ncbi:hypothetical protein [Demequina sp. NBRC 110052]|uniref:hypothetical protein n=1 Tax=Demequina sp. NBRC 110052 TaxID=1570341 RepID=UPI000A03CFDE|nr:hypothetical protein [Demequina sp. NBRC 110052]